MSTVKVNREEEVTVPGGQSMMVDTSDWARVRKAIESLGDPLADRASSFAAVLAGAALSLVGVIVSIHVGETKPDPSLSAGLWVAFGFCVVFAIVFLLMGKSEKRRYHLSNNAICRDMDDLAKRAGHPGLGTTERVRRRGIRARLADWWHGEQLDQSSNAAISSSDQT